jgi:hypothetical protein
MKISEYIEALQNILYREGDLEVEIALLDGDRVTAIRPKITKRLMYHDSLEYLLVFECHNDEDTKGDKVVRV